MAFILSLIFLLLFLFSVFLILPLDLILKYDQNLSIKIKILGFSVDLASKNRKAKKGNYQKSDSDMFKSLPIAAGENSITGTIKFFFQIAKELLISAKILFERIVIKDLTLSYSISEEDSFETSIRYGKMCILIYNFLGILDSINSPKHLDVNVSPNYNSEQSFFKINLHIHSRCFFIVYSALFFISRYIKYLKDQRNKIYGN